MAVCIAVGRHPCTAFRRSAFGREQGDIFIDIGVLGVGPVRRCQPKGLGCPAQPQVINRRHDGFGGLRRRIPHKSLYGARPFPRRGLAGVDIRCLLIGPGLVVLFDHLQADRVGAWRVVANEVGLGASRAGDCQQGCQ